MDPNQLLSSAVELGLELLESRGSFLPYCKAVGTAGEPIVYSPATADGEDFTEEQAFASIWTSVFADLGPRGLVGAAFCRQTHIRFEDSEDRIPAIEVELHYRGQPPAVWHFVYQMDGNTANVQEYYTSEAGSDLFSESQPGTAPDPTAT
jgi:hypothetical protein